MRPAIRTLIGLALAAGLMGCQTSAGDRLPTTGSPQTSLLSNPTNGGPAYVGVLGR